MSFQDRKQDISKLIERARITKNLSWYKKVVVPKIVKNKARYQELADAIGCPLALGAIIHYRENAGDLGKFKAYLGNGQPLTKRTTWVPKNRGPFKTWQAGAIDAFRLKGFQNIEDWSLERVLYEGERYNGFGYFNRNIHTPYVWAGTNIYTKGKFVRDGVFDRNVVDKNLGIYAMYLMLIEADKDFEIGLSVPTNNEPKAPEQKQSWVDVVLDLLKSIFNIIKEHNPSPKTQDEDGTINEPRPVVPAPATSMNRNKAILLFGSSTIGIKEIPGSGSNPEVEKYLDYGEADNDAPYRDNTPWCAGWQNYVLKANPHIKMGGTDSLMARSFEGWGVSTLKDPLPGDIVTRYRGVKSKGFGHVHVFCGWHKKGESYYGMGGNQNDEVNVSLYTMGKVTDFRRSSKIKLLTEGEKEELWNMAKDIIDGKDVQLGGKVT